jgi:hypothetical protein
MMAAPASGQSLALGDSGITTTGKGVLPTQACSVSKKKVSQNLCILNNLAQARERFHDQVLPIHVASFAYTFLCPRGHKKTSRHLFHTNTPQASKIFIENNHSTLNLNVVMMLIRDGQEQT